MKELEGDIALVTGGARGLGGAMAEELGLQGARVVIADLEAEVCEAKVADLRSKGIDADYVLMDITDFDAVRAAAADVQSRIGDISILVNNAGYSKRLPIEDPDAVPHWKSVIDINLNGTYQVTVEFLEQLKRTKGRIVSVSSVVGLRSGFTSAGYAAAKGAIKSLTQQLARDLAQYGIRVNAIAPGYMDSGLGMKGNAEAEAWLSWHCPMQRFGEPHEVAGPVAFLVGPKASFITGVTLPVDGGYLVV